MLRGSVHRLQFAIAFLLVLPLVSALPVTPSVAVAASTPITFGNSHFQSTWAYTDLPVTQGQANRTWMWGPAPDSPEIVEPYWDSPTGWRVVQFFDKSRMEITNPGADANSLWYVTNGLLAKEMITGQMQVGDDKFVSYSPAQVNVAGDANDPNGPTYATFNTLMGDSAIPSGWVLTQTVNRAGTVGKDSSLASYHVTAKDVGAPTHHSVASVFWTFMNSSGTVEQNGKTSTGKLFQNPFYATGYPLTEAYWTRVLVGGIQRRVLVQVFERRVLTYTPSNSSGWQVEAGNVGQHYYAWRYGQLKQVPIPYTALASTPASVRSCSGPDSWTSTDPNADTYYGQHVTIAYNETVCNVFHPEAGVWWNLNTGTATIYAGNQATGTPIETRPVTEIFYFHDPGDYWGQSARWNRSSTEQLYRYQVIDGRWIDTNSVTNNVEAYGWTVDTIPPQSNSGSFAEHPTICGVDSFSAPSLPFGMTFDARLDPNTLDGAPKDTIPYVFEVGGVNLDTINVHQAVTLPPGATLGYFPSGNCLFVYMSPSIPAGQYTVSLHTPGGQQAATTFQFNPTIPSEPSAGNVILQPDLSTIGMYKSGGATTSVANGVLGVNATGINGGISSGTGKRNDLTNSSISVDVRFDAAGSAGYACVEDRLHFPSTSTNQADRWINLCLLGSGETVAELETPSDETLFDRAIRTGTNQVTSWNTLTITAQGDLFWFSINGHVIGSAEVGVPPASSSQTAGFTIWSSQDAAQGWQVRNFVIRSLQ